MARAEAIDSVDARECRKSSADSRSSRTHDAVFEYRVTISVLVVFPDVVFHGCRRAFSVPQRFPSLTGNTPAQTYTPSSGESPLAIFSAREYASVFRRRARSGCRASESGARTPTR